MAAFTVRAARHKKTVQGQAGPLQIIAMVLDDNGSPIDAEWATKTETPVPAEGQVLEGTLEPSQYGMKFRKTPAGGFSGAARPEDPGRARRIMRQHSQHMSLLTITLAVNHGIIEPPADSKGLFELISRTSDWFDKDGDAAGPIA